MYRGKRFRIRPEQEVVDELTAVSDVSGSGVKRIFLADGDPLVIKADSMVRILEVCRSLFPKLERVTTYATPQNLLRKSPADLRKIREAGLTMLYYGVESGHDPTLDAVVKGVSADEIAAGAEKAHEAGFALSVTVLLGLAGRDRSLAHAVDTAALLSRIDPFYASALTIMDPDMYETDLDSHVEPDKPWGDMDVWDLLKELREMISGMDVSRCIFRSNHASNYLPLKGVLPADQKRLLEMIDRVLRERRDDSVRPEGLRGL